MLKKSLAELEAHLEPFYEAAFDSPCYRELIVSLKHKYPEEAKVPAYDKTCWTLSAEGHELSFTQVIEYYGEEHFAVWKCRRHLREDVLRYLLLCPAPAPEVYDETVLGKVHLQLGLMSASEGQRSLQVAEIAMHLEYRIIVAEDGEETVVPLFS